mmetsp:Transcript_4042/g.16180  ORF Transcript_4042/g.16180 Transcript_4042/m.16180 type:complete len:263 (+) Transcript_4042:1899-2687(+)
MAPSSSRKTTRARVIAPRSSRPSSLDSTAPHGSKSALTSAQCRGCRLRASMVRASADADATASPRSTCGAAAMSARISAEKSRPMRHRCGSHGAALSSFSGRAGAPSAGYAATEFVVVAGGGVHDGGTRNAYAALVAAAPAASSPFDCGLVVSAAAVVACSGSRQRDSTASLGGVFFMRFASRKTSSATDGGSVADRRSSLRRKASLRSPSSERYCPIARRVCVTRFLCAGVCKCSTYFSVSTRGVAPDEHVVPRSPRSWRC